jgi:hypothetical protein
MVSFLRDGIWQFVGVILSIIAISVTVIIYFRQRKLKEISYEIISESSLLSVSKEVEGKLQILLDGQPVKGVHLILFRIANTGNLPILPSDYLKNLNILFDGNANILSAEITNLIPKDIDTTINVIDKSISFSPSLLNSEDTIVLKVLVSEFNGNIDVVGRIAGIKNIKRLRSSVSYSSKFYVIASILSPIIAFLLNPFTRWEYGFTLFSSILLSYILIVIPIIYDRKYRDIVSEILQNVGIQKSFHTFIYTIIPTAIVIFGVTTNTEVKCSIGLESERICSKLSRIELIIQTTKGIPLGNVEVMIITLGTPVLGFSDSNGYFRFTAGNKDTVRITLTKEGFATQSLIMNVTINPSTVRVIRMKSLDSKKQ